MLMTFEKVCLGFPCPLPTSTLCSPVPRPLYLPGTLQRREHCGRGSLVEKRVFFRVLFHLFLLVRSRLFDSTWPLRRGHHHALNVFTPPSTLTPPSPPTPPSPFFSPLRVVWCAVVCCGVLCAVLCCAVLCCAVLCCAVLCCAVLCCAVLCCAVLCCAVLCCAVLCAVLLCGVGCCGVRCGVVWGAVRCGAVRCGAVWCGVVWCGAVQCGAVVWRGGVVWCGAMRCTCGGGGGAEGTVTKRQWLGWSCTWENAKRVGPSLYPECLTVSPVHLRWRASPL